MAPPCAAGPSLEILSPSSPPPARPGPTWAQGPSPRSQGLGDHGGIITTSPQQLTLWGAEGGGQYQLIAILGYMGWWGVNPSLLSPQGNVHPLGGSFGDIRSSATSTFKVSSAVAFHCSEHGSRHRQGLHGLHLRRFTCDYVQNWVSINGCNCGIKLGNHHQV